jgi:hypothetical protein
MRRGDMMSVEYTRVDDELISGVVQPAERLDLEHLTRGRHALPRRAQFATDIASPHDIRRKRRRRRRGLVDVKLAPGQYISKINGVFAVVCTGQRRECVALEPGDAPVHHVHARTDLPAMYEGIDEHLGWDYHDRFISTNSAGVLIACSEGHPLTILSRDGGPVVIDPMDYFGRFYFVGLSDRHAVCSDSGHGAVLVFGLDGSEEAIVTSDSIQTPYGVDIDRHGRVFIACARTSRVLVSHPPDYDDVDVVGRIDGTPGALVVHDSKVWLEVSTDQRGELVEVVSMPYGPRLR